MDRQPVSQPPQPDTARGAISQALKRAFRQQEDAITSIGELMLPTVLGAMEACLVDTLLLGLANARIFGTGEPLLPLWAPFVFLVGMQWLLFYLEQRFPTGEDEQEEARAGVRSVPVLFIFIGLFDLLMLWIELYSPLTPLYDLRWLGTLVSDILFLNTHFYQAIFIVALSFFLSWRGLRRAGRVVEPSTVLQTTWLGLGCFIAVILMLSALKSAGVALQNELLLFLLIPGFLLLALAGHALARISFVRQSHVTGLQGSVVAQERAVLTVIGMLALVVALVTVLIGIVAGPAFLSVVLQDLTPVGMAIGAVYNWLVGVLANLVVILVTPFVWLLQLFVHFFPPSVPQQNPKGYRQPTNPKPKVAPPALASSALIPILKVVLPILLLALIVFIFWLAVRRRRKLTLLLHRRDSDLHESLWTWALFFSQIRAMLRALLRRFLPEKEPGIAREAASVIDLSADPAARSIRDIYRLLLRRAAAFGVARKKDETPYEFQQRLHEKLPQVEPQLGVITEAYAMVRYGGSLPNADDLAHVQGQWSELNQKWV